MVRCAAVAVEATPYSSDVININVVVVTYFKNVRNSAFNIQSSSIFIELLVSGIASVVFKINGRQ